MRRRSVGRVGDEPPPRSGVAQGPGPLATRTLGRGTRPGQLCLPSRARVESIDPQRVRPCGDPTLLSRVRRRNDRTELGEGAGLRVGQDLTRRTNPFRRSPFHEALEILGAVLAGEMDGPIREGLAGFFVAAEGVVLANFPIRVRAVQ